MPVAAPVPADRTSRPTTGTFRSPVARLLDVPHLERLVPHFAPEVLQAIIRHSGLHACGELVAAATPAQLTSVFDIDLWRHAQPGQDEQFDEDRFGEWLEMLAETGGGVAARIVAGLDRGLVVAGLSRYIRVFDPSSTALAGRIVDDELSGEEMVPPGGPECELGGYVVRAVKNGAWDAIVSLLQGLEAAHTDCFHALMHGCRGLSDSAPEVDGLDELLPAPEQLLHDIAADREHRQSQQGYSTPADARAFLQGARRRNQLSRNGPSPRNPIAAAYFRAADDTAASSARERPTIPSRAPESAQERASLAEGVDAVVDVLAEAGLLPRRTRALLEGAAAEPSRLRCIRPLMEYVGERDEGAHFARSRELAFLANTLMAGCSLQSRPFTAQEASDAAVSICNLGLEGWADAETRDASKGAPCAALPQDFLVSHDLVTAFEMGWAVLYEDVSLAVAHHLLIALKGLRCADREIQRELAALRSALMRERSAGMPWRARGALDVLAVLDMPAWASLRGLLNECPVLPEALTATLAGRTGAVSATSFDFISTRAQIDAVGAFMARLPDVLRP